jgi:methylthioribose-1-phosphate isomerase
MNVDGNAYRSIWVNDDNWSINIIDQTRLPHAFEIKNLQTLDDACGAIRDMQVRGAPLIGATAAYGYYLAMRNDPSDAAIEEAWSRLFQTRPTAVNLRWALDRVKNDIIGTEPGQRADQAFAEARRIADEDVETNQAIGRHGLELIKQAAAQKQPGEAVNILTHCNAGWLATVDWGTATAPIYMAHDAGIPVHVWVDETRPRNQGASLTAWELGHHGVPHNLIVDNLGGHLMQHGMVDLCLVGSDRTTSNGDVCNKIGTYLKALAANDNGVPFYVCLPGSTIDWNISDGVAEVPIEQRDEQEVSHITGRLSNGEIDHVSIVPDGTPSVNYAFDVTPARLVSGLVTERGIVQASTNDLKHHFPESAETGL